MNLHLLRLFATVAEQGSFSRAASMLYISQPAISKGVQELERQLGTALLDRSGRGVTLTEAGATLFQHAQQLFAVERAAEAALEQLEGLERGQLAIGASSTIGIYLLPPLLGRFRQRYPGIRLFLDIGNTQQIGERLRTTPLDTVFVEGPVDLPHTDVRPWRDDRLVVIAAPDHWLVGQRNVPIHVALAEPFVLREQGSGTRNVIEQALRERGVALRITMELGSTEAIKQVVSAGLGLAIVSEATIALELLAGRLAILDVPELTLGRVLTQLHVVGRPPSRALQAFEALLRE
jgi:DNA-binding transcriptional LysR family regulator